MLGFIRDPICVRMLFKGNTNSESTTACNLGFLGTSNKGTNHSPAISPWCSLGTITGVCSYLDWDDLDSIAKGTGLHLMADFLDESAAPPAMRWMPEQHGVG